MPLIAAAVVPEIAKTLASLGPAKDNNVMDLTVQPSIKITKFMLKNNPDLLKIHPTGRMPHPFWGPIRYQLPAWLFIVAAIAGVSVWALLVYGLDNIRKDLGLSDLGKGGSLPNPLDILSGITNPVQGFANLGKAGGWW